VFSILEQEIGRRENQAHLSMGRRWLYYAGVFVASAIAFGALYLGIRFLE
jgi:arginine exporter protein ArgO